MATNEDIITQSADISAEAVMLIIEKWMGVCAYGYLAASRSF